MSRLDLLAAAAIAFTFEISPPGPLAGRVPGTETRAKRDKGSDWAMGRIALRSLNVGSVGGKSCDRIFRNICSGRQKVLSREL